MIVEKSKLDGAFIIKPERFDDERGFFARAWSEEQLKELRVESHFIAGNISFFTILDGTFQ